MWNKKKVARMPHIFRYLKLEVDSQYGSDKVIQMSRIEFIDSSGNYVNAPTMSNYNLVGCTAPSAEQPPKAFDHSVDTKMCLTDITFPISVTMDFGQLWLNTNIYNRWQWYTANDFTPARNMKTYRLYGSVDGNTWYLFDSQVDGSYTTQTKTLAYTGNIIVRRA